MSYSALTRGRYSQAGQIYLVTTVLSGRLPLFRDFTLAAVVARELHRLTRGDAWAWVIMPDHVHALIELRTDSLCDVVQGFKGRTSYFLRRGPVWQRGFHDHALRMEEDVAEIARYIVANPLRAGIVRSLRDYPFWDAKWL